MTPIPPLVVVMGVSGAGKTTVGRLLAEKVGLPFCEGDDLHPPANKQRMARGRPLDDAHRWPWLEAIRERLVDAARRQTGLVVACSALKQSYRRHLEADLPAVLFVLLDVDRATLQARLQQRRGPRFFR